MNKDQEINIRIIAALTSGMDIRTAFDYVLGEGAYINFANTLYNKLNSK